VRNVGLLSGFDVAQFIADVDHFVMFQGEGFSDRAEVAGLAGEFGGGGDEIEKLADFVVAEKEFDVGGGVGCQDAEILGMIPEFGECIFHAIDELEPIDVFPHQAGSPADEWDDPAFGDIELLEDIFQG